MRNRRHQWVAFSLFSFQDIITSVMGIVILILMVSALELVSRQLESPAVQNRLVRSDLEGAITAAAAQLARIRQAIAAGGWDDLAKLSAGDIDRELAALSLLVPVLEEDLKSANQRLAQSKRRHQKAEAELADRAGDRKRLEKLEQDLAAIQRELARIGNTSALFYRLVQSEGRQAWLVQISGDEIRAALLGPKRPPEFFRGNSADSQFLAWARNRRSEGEYFVLLIKPSGIKISHEIQEELRERGFGVGLDFIGSKQTAVDAELGAPLVDQESGASSS